MVDASEGQEQSVHGIAGFVALRGGAEHCEGDIARSATLTPGHALLALAADVPDQLGLEWVGNRTRRLWVEPWRCDELRM